MTIRQRIFPLPYLSVLYKKLKTEDIGAEGRYYLPSFLHSVFLPLCKALFLVYQLYAFIVVVLDKLA